MYPDTYRTLKTANLGSDQALALALASDLKQHEVTDLAQVSEGGRSIDEMFETLVGTGHGALVHGELTQIVSDMTRPSGLVKTMLDDGYTLCSTRLRRIHTDDNGDETVALATVRFVTRDDRVAERFLIAPMFESLEGTVQRVADRVEEEVQRHPQLAARVAPMISRLHGVVQRQLPAGDIQ